MASKLNQIRLRFSETVRRIRSLYISDTFRKMPACDVVVCCADCDRTDNLDGVAYSRMADGLIEELEQRGVVVRSFALPYARLTGRATWARAYTANRYYFAYSILGYFFHLLRGDSFLEQKFENVYTRILAITGARSLVGIGLPPSAIRAAKVANVRSVEILHGYGYSSIPWGWETAAAELLPDMVLAYDEVSAATFRRLQDKGVDVLIIENYWYRKFLNPVNIQTLPHEWRNLHWLPEGRKIVLVSLSWGYDGDHGGYTFFDGILTNGLYPDELEDVIDLAGGDYYWIFRLHPVQLSGTRFQHYKRVLSQLCRKYGNCEWELGSQTALPLLLNRCDAHISMISMSAYDAAYFGVCSMMLCPTLRVGGPNEMMFKDLEELGILKRGDIDALEIYAWLQSVTKVRRVSPSHVDISLPALSELLSSEYGLPGDLRANKTREDGFLEERKL